MKKRKRVISTLLVAALAASMLAVTSGAAEVEDTADSSDDVTVTSYGEYTAENPYHVVFSYIELYEQDSKATQAVEDALNEYMIPTYHMEVEFLPLQYAEASTSIQLMMSGKDELDIIPIYFTEAASWINMGGIVDLNQYVDTEDGKKIIEALGEENAYVGSMNGVLYGFPANKESIDVGGLYMRADICDELGITEKYNLEDYISGAFPGEIYDWSVATDIFSTVHEAYPDMTCLYMMQSDQISRFIDLDPLIDTFGVLNLQADRDSTTVVNFYETDEYYEACKLIAEWYDAGYVYQDAATDTQGTATMMKAGNTFSYITPIKPGFLSEADAANGTKGYVIYCKIGGGTDGPIATTNVSFYNTGIATNSKDPEMAFKFISALYSDPVVMNLWQYGIEGDNYQILDDGTIYYIDGEDDGNYSYHQNTGWMMGNQFIGYVWNDGSKEADYWDVLAAHNDYAYYSPAFGFAWDSSAYSTQVTALNNALATYQYTLCTGSCGVDGLDDTIQKLNDALYAAGLEEVMEAKQEQLDAWLAEKE